MGRQVEAIFQGRREKAEPQGYVAKLLLSIPAVEQVLFDRDGEDFVVWTVGNSLSREDRLQIYNTEASIFEQIPGIGFEFHVVDRGDRPLNEILTGVPLRFAR